MSDPIRTSCPHVRAGEWPATVRLEMQTIAGALTRADLNTTTELCSMCAGRAVQALMRIERGELKL